MSTPIDPGACRTIKVLARPSIKAILSSTQVRLGDLEVPLVMHVYSDSHVPILTVACTRHRMQHNKERCEIRVFDESGETRGDTLQVTLADFEESALCIVRTQFDLGKPHRGGFGVRVLQTLQRSVLILSIVVTGAAVIFILSQLWEDPAALLESKNPAMVVAWLLPGSGLFAVAAWLGGKVEAIRSARL